VIIALVAAVSSCSSPAAKPQAAAASSAANTSASPSSAPANSAPTAPPPAGYKWTGSTALGLWFAVPDSWAAVNLAKVSLTQAVRRFTPKGVSNSFIENAIKQLSQQHGVFVADLASAVRSPNQLATNGNAFCTATPLVPGAGSASALKASARAQYAALNAHILVLKEVTIGGDAGVKSEFTLITAAGVKLTDTQYLILTKSSRLCTITFTTDRPAPFRPVFSKIGTTIHVGP
jgi:hypothetical protein